MHIAHIVCRFPPYAGGMGMVAFRQAKKLAEEGHRVTVFTLASKPRLDSDKLGFQVRYLKALPRLGNAGFTPQLMSALKKFDVIQLHYPFYGAQEMIWLGKKLGLYKKAKIIIWYHMDASFKNVFFKIWHWKTWLLQKSLFKQADKICAASFDYLESSKIRKLYQKQPAKFIQIPFGTNQNPKGVRSQSAQKLKTQLGIKFSDKIILFVGGLDNAHYFKGVPILIDAIHKLNNKNIKLIIVGDGNLRDDYERQVSGLNLAEQIIFIGHVEQKELAYYYFISDLTVLPSTSRAEAFGLVLVEAKTFGKPVIGSDLPGVRDVVGESGLTAKRGNADDLAEKIKKILTDKKLYDEFSGKALEEIKQKYNWDKHIQKLEEVYKSTNQ
jgi:glycosyltransferase involved in cell wall biosynthesis